MGWLDLTEVRAEAAAIADEYCRLRASAAGMGMGAERRERRYDKVRARASAAMQGLGWNLYKKSRFAQLLRGALLERRVPDEEAEAFARAALVGPLVARHDPAAR